jgi:hypothetical protein
MATLSGRSRTLSLLIFLAALPAAAQQSVLEPVRLPASFLAAPMVGTQLGALGAPTLRMSLTPSLQAPTLTTTLVPQVQVQISPAAASPLLAPAVGAPMQAAPGAPALAAPAGYAFAQSGLYVPVEHAASALGASLELGKAVSRPNAPVSQVFSSFYDGSGRAPAAAAVDASPVAAPAASGYLAQTQGQSGAQLLGSLHQITGRNYHAHEYKDASQYMFGTADNITSHGVRGVVDAYSGIFVPGSSHNGGDYSEHGDQDGDGFPEQSGMNVEHTWPQSFFNKSLPMRSDLHHLLPTFQHPNSMRSNLPFGEVQGQPEYHNNGGAKEGHGMFEPPDVSKGKVARAVLYFYTRYYDRDISEGAYNHGFFKDRIDMFLRWNREHPPTPDELRRNDLVEKFQGNRNPFTDDFTLADRIGAAGFTGVSPVRGEQASQRQESRPQPQAPERRHGRHHHGHGSDRRFASVSSPGRLSPLDFALR